MYVNNVREALDRLTEDEFEEYLKRLRLVLRKRYKKNVKPSDLRNRVKEFISGKDPKIDYFESYLLTFDELSVNGAINVLHSKKIKMPKTWRQLLLFLASRKCMKWQLKMHTYTCQIPWLTLRERVFV
ncbi:hypothetical protein, partial [Parageobacillus thermoglucosidasius]|uniref:hypothetical protein n=2 Tax=Parageobacillus thermoglucosidasius TaxID=1426 RepID=UPI003D2E1BFE